MDLVTQYRKQQGWRHWDMALDILPLKPTDLIGDFGCSVGFISNKIAGKVEKVYGVDTNPKLLAEAHKEGAPNIEWIEADLANTAKIGIPPLNGIWSSFTIAYFPDPQPCLTSWRQNLVDGGWILLVEIDKLFSGHGPLPAPTAEAWKNFESWMADQKVYDSSMGSALLEHLHQAGFNLVEEFYQPDPEFSFQGPATKEIYEAWEIRFERVGIKKLVSEFFGEKEGSQMVAEFLACLSADDHYSNSEVLGFLATK